MNFVGSTCAFVAGLMLWPSPVMAQNISLSEAVAAAWQLSTEAAEVSGQRQRADADQQVADAPWAAVPSVELSRLDDRLLSDTGRSETELALAVPIWLPGQRAAFGRAAAAGLGQAEAAQHAGLHRMTARVRDAAWAVLASETELAAARSEAASLTRLADDVERRVRAGDLARADALAARAEQLAATSEVAGAERRLRQQRLAWTTLTGQPLLPDLRGAPDQPHSGPQSGPQSAAAALDQHPLLLAANSRLALAQRRLEAVQASPATAPEVLARVRRDQAGAGLGSQHALGLAIRIPLGTADRNAPQRAAALSELASAEQAQRQRRATLAQALTEARDLEQVTRQQLAREQARARLLTERAALIDKAFSAGEISLPETLRALAAAQQARARVLRQEDALGQARGRVDQALGVAP